MIEAITIALLPAIFLGIVIQTGVEAGMKLIHKAEHSVHEHWTRHRKKKILPGTYKLGSPIETEEQGAK